MSSVAIYHVTAEGPSRAQTSGPGEDDLAEHVSVEHPGEAVASLLERQHLVDHRPDAGDRAHLHQPLQLVASAHGGADHPQLQEEDPLQLGRGRVAAGGTAHHDGAARLQRPRRVRPGGRPTVSMTASTRSGSRAPDSNAWSAPSSTALARLASSRPVTHIRYPAADPSATSAVDTPPPAP